MPLSALKSTQKFVQEIKNQFFPSFQNMSINPCFATPSFLLLNSNFHLRTVYIHYPSIPYLMATAPTLPQSGFTPQHSTETALRSLPIILLLFPTDTFVALILDLFVLFDTADFKASFYLGFHDVTLPWY